MWSSLIYNLTELFPLSPQVISYLQADGEIAFLTASLHYYRLISKCLSGAPDRFLFLIRNFHSLPLFFYQRKLFWFTFCNFKLALCFDWWDFGNFISRVWLPQESEGIMDDIDPHYGNIFLCIHGSFIVKVAALCNPEVGLCNNQTL